MAIFRSRAIGFSASLMLSIMAQQPVIPADGAHWQTSPAPANRAALAVAEPVAPQAPMDSFANAQSAFERQLSTPSISVKNGRFFMSFYKFQRNADGRLAEAALITGSSADGVHWHVREQPDLIVSFVGDHVSSQQLTERLGRLASAFAETGI